MEASAYQFSWLTNPKYRVAYHILFWVAMYLDEILSVFGITEAYNNYGYTLIELASDLALVYFNLYVLIPYFLRKNKFALYIVCTVLTLFLNALAAYFLYYFSYEDGTHWRIEFFVGTILTTGTLLVTAICFNIF
ncbi:MAG: hypothetical protein AAGK97_04010, partial [Bacteroidota bacterium]